MTLSFTDWTTEQEAESLRWFHALHAMPETGFGEARTAAYVASELRKLGLEVVEGIGGTGLVGLLRRGAFDAPFIGLRAELDALPMQGPADGTVQTPEGPCYHGTAMTGTWRRC